MTRVWASQIAALGVLGCLGLGSLVAAGCAAPQDTGPRAPAWVGIDQQAFPDDIAPRALGLPAPQKKPYADPQIRERTRRAEVVARVRVQTVSVERRSNGDPVYRIGLQLAEPRLVARKPMPDQIEVVIVPGGPAHALARAWDVRLQGMVFVGYFKRYDGGEGEPTIHFHLDPDDPAIGTAVEQFAALDEVRGS